MVFPPKMVEQNLSVSRTISDGLMTRALILGLEQITQYGEMYREAINLFKNKHFEDRSQVCFRKPLWPLCQIPLCLFRFRCLILHTT